MYTTPRYRIQEICLDDAANMNVLAQFSTDAAKQNSSKWLSTKSDAMKELRQCVIPSNYSRMATKNNRPVGWISSFPINKLVWEIHPLLIDPDNHGEGIGTHLVKEVEQTLRARGVQTIQVSTTDATNATNLSEKDLYIDPLGELQRLDVRDATIGHAFKFWVRSGYKVVGVIPDAEGIGIPSICLAKRLVPFSIESHSD